MVSNGMGNAGWLEFGQIDKVDGLIHLKLFQLEIRDRKLSGPSKVLEPFHALDYVARCPDGIVVDYLAEVLCTRIGG